MRAIFLASVAPLAFNSEVCETVNIKGPGGKPVRVNKSDYDADQADGGAHSMKLHKDDAEQSVPGSPVAPIADGLSIPPAPSAPDFAGLNKAPDPATAAGVTKDEATGAVVPPVASPGQLFVSTEGTGTKARSFVVDAAGNKLTDRPGIDPKGYSTEQDAWNAILALPH